MTDFFETQRNFTQYKDAKDYIDSMYPDLKNFKPELSNSSILSIRYFVVSSMPSKIRLLGGYGMLWESNLAEAECLCFPARFPSMQAHVSTEIQTALCGIYSFKFTAPDTVKEDYSLQPLAATAIVKNYGAILELEHGYRAEVCELQSIFLKKEILMSYSVTPDMIEEFKATYSPAKVIIE